MKHRLVAGESDPTLTCDKFVSDPDGKFTGFTADRFNVDTQFFFEQRRYPSSAGWIRRSNEAVANDDFHMYTSLIPRYC